jgi:glutamine amidotransferase
MGNLGSILNMLKKIGVKAIISSDISDIDSADMLILPGVGSFDNGVKNLKELGFVSVLNNRVLKHKTPILGICLGIQLFTKRSEEGNMPGLGWIDAKTVRFKFDKDDNNLKIPHMGWNTIKINQDDIIFKNMLENARFYFVHSYHLVCNNKKNILAKTHYGYDFVSVVKNENIWGVQFHPEKSHKFGMQILKNFVEID